MALDGSMRVWNSPRLVGEYRARSHLSPAELACLGEIWQDVKGRDVLDIGVGTGRTVPFLAPLAGRYVAVDSAPEMVRACRTRYPGTDVREADARDLAAFTNASFDLVVFSFNSIDYMPPPDRPRALAAIFRVLRPDGYFLFSSHNLSAVDPVALGRFALPEIALTVHPVKMAKRALGAAALAMRSWLNHRRLASSQEIAEHFALVNDGAYGGSLLTCYVRPSWQIEALAEAGFTLPPALFGLDGRTSTVDAKDDWLHYLARKPVNPAAP